MKMITAIIQPFKLDAVRDALGTLGVQGLTVTEVKGYGRQKGQTEIYRGAEYQIHYVPKLQLTAVVEDSVVDRAVDVIRESASQNKIGDGKIFVSPVEAALRIRTGETGDEAL
ncbi:MAG: P-II family nitrogen regulator [Rhizobiaceae bacterium]